MRGARVRVGVVSFMVGVSSCFKNRWTARRRISERGPTCVTASTSFTPINPSKRETLRNIGQPPGAAPFQGPIPLDAGSSDRRERERRRNLETHKNDSACPRDDPASPIEIPISHCFHDPERVGDIDDANALIMNGVRRLQRSGPVVRCADCQLNCQSARLA